MKGVRANVTMVGIIGDRIMSGFVLMLKGEPMRLIDADALIDDLEHDVAIDQDTLDFEELTEINRANIQFDKDCKQNAIDLLKNAPTIEPERKKGRWIRGGSYPHHIFCSACYATYVPNDEWNIWKTDGTDCWRLPRKFCPNCGAEMSE